MADIFISYTSSDREWADWVGHEIESLGHTPRIHDWEISGGGDIAAWMEERIDAADHVLCIISSAYLDKKPYSAWERRAAQCAAVTDRPIRVPHQVPSKRPRTNSRKGDAMISTIDCVTLNADTGGACHSSPRFSKTGLSAYLKSRLKEPLLKNGALSAKKLGFQSAAKPMNPETCPNLRSRVDSGSGTSSMEFALVRNNS